MTLLSVCRLTPRTSAPSVTDRPKGSRQSFLTMRPGCAGFFIGMVSPCSGLVVVDQLNVKSIGPVEAKNDTPIRPHRDRPKPLPYAFERVKAIPGKIESLAQQPNRGRLESVRPFRSGRPYSAAIAALVQPLEAAMLKAPDHSAYTVKCTLSLVAFLQAMQLIPPAPQPAPAGQSRP